MDDNQNFLKEKQERAARNNENSAQAIRTAANVASSTANPYARAAGKSVQIADKLSGGKASEKLGKALSSANKMAGLNGKMAQAAINKLGNNGTSDRLSKAMSNKNKGSVGSSLLGSAFGKSKKDSLLSQSMENASQKETEEQMSDGGGSNFKVDFKIVRWGLIACAFAFPIIIFVALFTTASQVYLKAVGLGHADSVSDSKAESIINKKLENSDSSLNTQIQGFNYYIDDEKTIEFRNSKLESLNLEKVALFKKRKYNEATLEELEDFYPSISNLAEEYDKNLVYDFFLKMYNLYHYYEDNYKKQPGDRSPLIDLPLLMSTLIIESDDMNVVFKSNLDPKLKSNVEGYYYDWDSSNYKISSISSYHDMELLVQHMVSKRVEESCVDEYGKKTSSNVLVDSEVGHKTLSCSDGETYTTKEYYVFDDEKYREFLKEFIEKKYYIDDYSTIINNNSNGESTNRSNDVGDWRSWKQCGFSWSNITVPKSSKTLCNIGCLITSVTMQIVRSGTATVVDNVDPSVSVKKFSFVSGGNLVWASVKNLAPNFLYNKKIYLMGLSKEKIAQKINNELNKGNYIVLGVSKKDRTSVHHYVALDYVDLNTNKIYIIDPGSNNNSDLYDVYKLYTAHVFEKKD